MSKRNIVRAALVACSLITTAVAYAAPAPSAVGDLKPWMGTNQYLLEGQCLKSQNGRWFACVGTGNLRVRYWERTNGLVHWDTGVDCCQPGYKKVHVIMEDNGNIALWDGENPAKRSGVWWHANAVSNQGEAYFLVMQDDGNLCRYHGSDPAHNQGNKGKAWCTQTGRSYVEQVLRTAPKTAYNTDLAGAMSLFDRGAPVRAKPPAQGQFVVPGGQCMMTEYVVRGKCVNRKSSCWEVTNTSKEPKLIQTAWDNDDRPRQWALLKPGEVMLFDNRGGNDRVWCVNCGQVNGQYISDARGTRWGTWADVQIWRKWTDDNFPAGCKDNLALGSTHGSP